MLIILPEPFVAPEYDMLAVNVGSYDTFIVHRLHNCFQLALHKHFDGSFQIQSQLFVVLANLDSRENCEDLFQAIVKAIEKKDKVSHIAKYLVNLNKSKQQAHVI